MGDLDAEKPVDEDKATPLVEDLPLDEEDAEAVKGGYVPGVGALAKKALG